MKTRISSMLILAFLAVQVFALGKASDYGKRESTLRKHNDSMLENAKFMQNEARHSDDLFNSKAYLKRARKIKSHASKARRYVTRLQQEEYSVKKSETKFNKTIEHYDKILQEEFQVEKELGMPASDRHKLESHVSAILNELDELGKRI